MGRQKKRTIRRQEKRQGDREDLGRYRGGRGIEIEREVRVKVVV